MQQESKPIWRSTEEIVEIAFQRASVVMMNEAHNGLKRCIRTRQIGKRILPIAHQAGVRHLAMEALFPQFAEYGNRTRTLMSGDLGYLSQPEMKDFIQTALDLDWTLVPYEVNNFKWLSEKHGFDFSNTDENERSQRYREFQHEFTTPEFTNWREEQQALNLISALQSLPADTPMLVWCGNNHHSKKLTPDWIPMGYQFQKNSHMNPFVIDQVLTVKFDFREDPLEEEVTAQFSEDLAKYGGTAGLLIEEIPSTFAEYGFHELGDDALLFSTQNELE